MLLIVLGTIGLKVVPTFYTGDSLGWLDALFTATSAICVTGLIVVDTATYFTFAGQLYLLILIQLGGLGMLTFASVIITALGGRPSLRSEAAIAGTSETRKIPARKIMADILKFTLICETIGAAALYLIWAPKMGWIEAIWPSIFHSVSAFCNAGFSTNTDSLMTHANSSATLLVIACLIIAGGIGFIVMEELALYFNNRTQRLKRISTHTKVVLITTAILVILPCFCFALFEWNRSLNGLSTADKITNSVFLSVTPRTAGFNAIDYGKASDSTNLLTILLMIVGGSPGSTAGGLKTTTFMLLLLLAWSRLRGLRVAIFFDRSIPDNTIQQAMGLFVIVSALMTVGVFLTQLFDDPFGDDPRIFQRVFEVVSAFNTVGLSMGITNQLNAGAKLTLILMMFVGRVGPLAVYTAFESRFAKRSNFRLANEDVIIG
jgi:trk system potassium uptake protein